jgi:uncharacterized protein
MKTDCLKLILGLLTLACLTAHGAEISDLNDSIKGMDDAERQFNERQRQELVAFMSLETMFPDTKVRALARAAGRGNIRQIEKLVSEGVDVNARGTQGATPLFWAMRNYRGFKRLLELGADPNVVYADGNHVMIASTELRDRRILQSALEHGGNPNLATGDSFGNTPIFEAMSTGFDVVDLLLAHGADIDAIDKFGSSPVLVAAGRGDFEAVYNLLERGADYRLKNQNGRDLASRVAATVGKIRPGTKFETWQIKVIEWLRERGVEVSIGIDANSGG